MPKANSIQVPSPAAIKANLFPEGLLTPTNLPERWTTSALLTPHGNIKATGLAPTDQLIAARITYDGSDSTSRLLRARLFMVESLLYYDFLFKTDQNGTHWWSLVSNPDEDDSSPTAAEGPFPSGSHVPGPGFLRDQDFSHSGVWRVIGKQCNAFAGKRKAKASTWWWREAASDQPRRIMNIENGNDFGVAILGAYYFVDFVDFQLASTSLPEIVAKLPSNTNVAVRSAMRTATDIIAAMDSAPKVITSFDRVKEVIPGLVAVPQNAQEPAWSNAVQSECYMIGQDSYPYYCQVWYDWDRKCQVTVFVQKDDTDEYTSRFDEFLPRGNVGPAVIYIWSGSAWEASCSQKEGGFVPMPVPDFVKAGGGRCRAMFKNSPYFGNASIWSVALGDEAKWSNFWYWFDDAQRGIIFSLAPASSLTLIDYQSFVRDAKFDEAKLADPSEALSACGGSNLVAVRDRPVLLA